MAGYKEFWDDYDLNVENSAVTGTRAFVKVAGGPASLPKIGDPFNSDYKNCKLKKLKYVKLCPDRELGSFANKESDWKEKITCTYSTNANNPTAEYDENQRRFQMGGEILTIDNPTNWVWASAPGTVSVAQPIFISNVMGSFTRQIQFGSTSSKDKWINGKATDALGTINHAKFEGFRIGSVLWSGVSGGNSYDSQGREQWIFDCEFSYRVIRDETAAITQDDWLYIWRKDLSDAGNGKWDKPIDADSKGLYAKRNFPAIFGAGDTTDV